MRQEPTIEFLQRLFEATKNDCNDVWWSTDPLKFTILCNGVFYCACADDEEITPENIHLLEQSIQDANKTEGKPHSVWGTILFCCRSRQMRPQTPYYKYLPEELKPLFDACGPIRTDG